MSTSRKEVQIAIDAERDYQDAKWGTIEEHPHSIAEWIFIMEEEIREAKEAWLKGKSISEIKGEIVQAVATGMACMEEHGPATRGGWEDGLEPWVEFK